MEVAGNASINLTANYRMNKKFQGLLQGGDLRSIGIGNENVALVNTQIEFDDLFEGLYHSDRKVVMRTADAI